ncbi:GspE/PulE family protein [Candidatus Uabimicrobium amorphum]|uniref:Type II secretion system protein E n=1 Tax=Uabimicrobium amorphum TaxID=2596890 RepID=A0A5S9IJG3_UABAM|nr:GspE/PulE family protein [Candidatus Uabimicrobium amorphum]BBM82576.1 type II secretion system protein E [Candidatus Uabimicrobium amorphum]
MEKFVELEHFELDADSIQMLPYKFCVENRLVILNKVNIHSPDPITLGVIDDANQELLAEVKAMLNHSIKAVRLNAYEIQKAIDIGYGVHKKEDFDYTLTLNPISTISYDPDAPMSKTINEILGKAIALGASDIHIETYPDDIDVRFRVDGMLHQINHPLSKANIRTAISRLRILANLDVTEHRFAQDGRINSVYEEGGERVIDFRVSIVPGPFGLDAVMRVLDSSRAIVGLDKLGLNAQQKQDFENLVSSPEGLVLVAGPTGCGKTTTLYSALHHINTTQNKVVTVEDPIEYIFAKTNQKQINADMGFADYVRAFLRQNPDVIMIGEIRDEETAEVAFRAAQTGHLVLSTIHAIDSVRGFSRLKTLNVDSSVISACLLGILSQRLVRKLCPVCKDVGEPSDELKAKLRLPHDEQFYHAVGCEHCDGIGYKGRTGIYELFAVNDALAELINMEASTQEIRSTAREMGLKSLLEDALPKARKGITSLDELLRVIPYRIIAMER